MAGNQAFANYRSKRRAAELQSYSTRSPMAALGRIAAAFVGNKGLSERAIRLHPIQHEFRQLKKQIENAR